MSKRHRSQEAVPLPRAEQRAHAHGERHRVHSELHELAELVSHGAGFQRVRGRSGRNEATAGTGSGRSCKARVGSRPPSSM